jgi:hypothetical protein
MFDSQRCSHVRPRKGSRLLCLVLLSSLVALAAVGVPASASTESEVNVQKYLGRWNYNQPNLATLNNVAVLACPDGGGECDKQLPLPLKIPQIGWVVFSLATNGTVYGRTDQGCLWNFDVTSSGLELSSKTQTCFNHDIGSAYTLTRWSVTVEGNEEHEVIVSISHQPTGVDLIATMASGSRNRVTGVGGFHSFSRFLGGWTYDLPDFDTLVNVVSTDKGTVYPELGTVWITSDDYGTIVARTPDGCEWTLAVRGNTAELDPVTQTCRVGDGNEISLRYWSFVTDDGAHASIFRSGSTSVNDHATNAYLFIGAMTKTAPAPER